MAEIVVGVGRQKSIRKIIQTADAIFQKSRGVPGRIMGHSGPIAFEAERSDLDSDFDTFTLRISETNEKTDDLLKAASELGDICEHTLEGDTHTFIIGASEPKDMKAAGSAADDLSGHLTLPEVWRFDSDKYRTDPISMEMLFKAMLQYKASDIHLTPGQKPIFRVDNKTHTADIIGVLSAEQILDLIRSIAPGHHWEEFEEELQTSFNYHQAGMGYARTSAFLKTGSPHITFRYLPEKIPSFDELHIPSDMMEELSNLHDGLLLIAGMTGSGKTTTAASIIDWINQGRNCHILTIEDPIEYVHENKKAFISQRGLGDDVRSFGAGVQGALRHDPDVIFIGEMRDADTIRAAINAASTGHLVISTLHSNNASGSINRIISFFDPVERDLVRLQLQDSLRGVICQRLVPKKGGGRVPALEVLFNDIKPISRCIESGDTLGIRIGMQQNLSHSILFEQYIFQMYKDDLITLEAAKEAAPEISMFDQLLMGTYTIPRIL